MKVKLARVKKFKVRFSGQKKKTAVFRQVQIAIAAIRHHPSLRVTEMRTRRICLAIRGSGLRIEGTPSGMRDVRQYLHSIGISATALADTQTAEAV